MSDSIEQLWRAQPLSKAPVSVDEARARADKLRAKVRWRNGAETVAGALVALGSVPLAISGENDLPLVSRVGLVLIAPAAAFIVIYLWRFGRAGARPDASAPMPEHVAALRTELLRQAKLAADSWRWYFAPFLPALVLFNGGLVLEELTRAGQGALIITAFVIAFQVGFLALLMRANRRAAAALRAEVALLDG